MTEQLKNVAKKAVKLTLNTVSMLLDKAEQGLKKLSDKIICK